MKQYQIYIDGVKSGVCDAESEQDAVDIWVDSWTSEIGDKKVTVEEIKQNNKGTNH